MIINISFQGVKKIIYYILEMNRYRYNSIMIISKNDQWIVSVENHVLLGIITQDFIQEVLIHLDQYFL